MKKVLYRIAMLACFVTLLLTACKPDQTTQLGRSVEGGPTLITGSYTYSNDFVVETYYVEHAVALNDITGFVLRDKEWELPVEGQVLGFMDVDEENNRGTYRLALPAVPEGMLNDVDQDNRKDDGVQIFAVTYSPNLSGGVFSEGDDRSFGWPAYLASVKTDTENQDEIIGGRLVVWAQDDQQEFPSDFGEDSLLFTGDDPIMSLSAGYSVIDLDQTPFEIIRDQNPELVLYEPEDIAVKDYSTLSYVEAFDQLFEKVSNEYAFNGVAGKQPDWDDLYQRLAPKVEAAQQQGDSYAFYLALREFSMAFQDGHVSLSGGNSQYRYNQENILGGYGFSVRELSNGEVVVVYVVPGGPAEQAGMQVGAKVTAFDNLPIAEAIRQVEPFSPQSSDFGLRYEQTVFLTRSGIDQTAEVTFINPSGGSRTVALTSIYELDSLFATYLGGEQDENVLPAEYQLLLNGIGYIRINSQYDDLGLIVRIFQRALETFTQNDALGLIIDMRRNFGGSPLGLAGYLFDQEIFLGQLEYFSDKTGKFEADGPRDKVLPNVEQFRFDKMVLLVDQFCFSACEIESYGFSQVPGMQVIGHFPTGGVEAETARGSYLLPDGMEMTVPTGRYTLPDGSIFLEGTGVVPGTEIPVTLESVLSGEDVVLNEAIIYILQPG